MTLIDTLRPEHRRLLRRLRKRIARRENMRRYRNDINYMRLCPGVDLWIEAGTCGGLIWPEHPLHCLPQAPPLAPHTRVQPCRGCPVRVARRRRGRRRRARRRRARRLRPGRPPARRAVRTRRFLPALVAPEEALSSVDNADGIGAAHPASIYLCCPACGHDPPARVIFGPVARIRSRAVADRPVVRPVRRMEQAGRGARTPAEKLWAAPHSFCRPRPARRRFAVARWPGAPTPRTLRHPTTSGCRLA